MALFKYSQFLNETESQPEVVLNAPELPSLKPEPARVELQIPSKPSFACPDDHRRRSIVATVIFFPMGLFALHWSKKTRERHAANNKVGAYSASDKAKTFSFLGIVVGVVFWADSETRNYVDLKIPTALDLPPPKDYRRRSIVATVVCFPVGLVALHWSFKVHLQHKDNNKVGSVRASHEAKVWSFLALVIGIVFWTLLIFIIFVEVALSKGR